MTFDANAIVTIPNGYNDITKQILCIQMHLRAKEYSISAPYSVVTYLTSITNALLNTQ